MRINFSTKYIYYISRFQRPSSSLEGMVQMVHWSLPRCFSPGLTAHASCPHFLMREMATSRPAPFSAEEVTHLPRGAASSGACRLEAGSRCPSHSQRRDGAPASGTVVTNWSSWAACGLVKLRRRQRQSPVTELSPAALEWSIRQGKIMTSKVVKQIIKSFLTQKRHFTKYKKSWLCF